MSNLSFLFQLQDAQIAVPAPSVEAAHALLLGMFPAELPIFLGIAAH